jgi:hypothetical protein
MHSSNWQIQRRDTIQGKTTQDQQELCLPHFHINR